MKFLWLIYIEPEYLDFYGNIIGAVIGILGVYFSVLWSAKHTRNHDKELAEKAKLKEQEDQENRKLDEYHEAVVLAQSGLQECSIQNLANAEHLDYLTKIIRQRELSVHIPRTIVFDQSTMFRFRNMELVNKWFRLGLHIKSVNGLIDDFRSHYLQTANVIYGQQLRTQPGELEKNLNRPAVNDSYKLIEDFGSSVILACQNLHNQIMETLAIVTVHAKLSKDHFSALKEMTEYRVLIEEYENELLDLRKRFDPRGFFEQVKYGDPIVTKETKSP